MHSLIKWAGCDKVYEWRVAIVSTGKSTASIKVWGNLQTKRSLSDSTEQMLGRHGLWRWSSGGGQERRKGEEMEGRRRRGRPLRRGRAWQARHWQPVTGCVTPTSPWLIKAPVCSNPLAASRDLGEEWILEKSEEGNGVRAMGVTSHADAGVLNSNTDPHLRARFMKQYQLFWELQIICSS